LRSNKRDAACATGEPGLAGAGRSGAEHQWVALERAHIGVLAEYGPHRTLAQIDFLERGTRRRGIESNSEPCAIAKRNRAFESPWLRRGPRLICS